MVDKKKKVNPFANTDCPITPGVGKCPPFRDQGCTTGPFPPTPPAPTPTPPTPTPPGICPNNFTISGDHSLTLILTGSTDVILPTSGTLLSTANAFDNYVSSITGTANEITVSAATGAVILSTPIVFIAPGSITSTTTITATTALILTYATANAFLYSGDPGTVTSTAQATNGQLLIGSTGAAPVAATLTAGTGITITNAPGSITIAQTGGADVTSIAGTANEITASAATGAVTLSIPSTFIAPGSVEVTTTLTIDSNIASAFVYSNASKQVVTTPAPINGQLLIGSTGVNPVVATLTAGTGITITNAAGSITIAQTSGADVNSIAGTVNQIDASAPTGDVTLSTSVVFIAPGSIASTTTITATTGLSLTYGTPDAFLYTDATSVVQTTAAATDGQILIGSTGTIPVASTLTAGTGITIMNAAGSITIAQTAGSDVNSISFGSTGLTPATATTGDVIVAGTLVVANGGTGATAFTTNGVLFGNSTSPLGATAAGVTSQVLVGNTGLPPTWSTLSGIAVTSFQTSLSGLTPVTATTGDVTLAGTLNSTSGGTGTATAPTAGQILVGTSGGEYVPFTVTTSIGISTTTGSGTFQINNTGVTSIAGTANQIDASASTGAVTLSLDPTLIIPGSIASTTTITATTGLTLIYATANAFLYTDGTSAVQTTAQATDGQLLIGSTGAAPVAATLTGGTGITITNAAGSITIAQTAGADVTSITGTANQIDASASTGAVTLSTPDIFIAPGSIEVTSTLQVDSNTASSFVYSNASNQIVTTGAPTNGQLLIGSTGANPVIGTITGGTGLLVTLGAGTIALANTGVTSITGTANQIDASASTGPVTLSLDTTLIVPGSIASTTTITATTGLTLTYGTVDSFLYVGAAGAVISTATAINGQILIGSTGAAPVVATITTSGTGVSVTNGAGSITLANTGVTSAVAGTGISVSSATGDVTYTNTGVLSFSAGTTGLTPATATTGDIVLAGTLIVGNGGTGATTFTTDGVLYGNGTSPLGVTAAGTTGQVLTGNTGGAPTWTTISSGFVTSITGTANEIAANGVFTAQTGDVTLTIPTTLIAPGSATVTTDLTIDGLVYESSQTNITATGVDQSTAFQLTKSYDVVTLTTAISPPFNGVRLPPSGVGLEISVVNLGSSTLNVYPNGLDAIDGAASGVPVELPSRGTATYQSVNVGNWYTIDPVIVSADAAGLLVIYGNGQTVLSNTGVTSFSTGTTGLTTVASTGAITLAGTLVVANGGTGDTTLALNGVLYGNGTSPVGVVAAGTTGQVLVATTSAAPSWSTLSSIAVTSFQTTLSGLTPSTATTGIVTLAGTLGVASGGTGDTSLTPFAVLVGEGTSPVNQILASAQYQILTANNGTSADPIFGAVNLTSTSAVSGQLPVGSGGTGDSTLTLNGVLYGNGTSPVGQVAAGTTGQVLVATTSAAPSWSTLSGIAVTSFQTSLSGLTPSIATTGVVTLAGTLGVASGGTGDITLTPFAVLVGEGVSPINQILASAQYQVLTANNGTGSDPIFGQVHLDQTAAVVGTLPVGFGGTGDATLTLNGVLFGNGTSPIGVTAAGTQYQVLQADAFGVPFFGAINLAQSGAVSGILGLTNGGTNASLTAVAGAPVYSTSTALAIGTAGTVGQAYISGGTGTPTWQTVSSNLNTNPGAILEGDGSGAFTATGATFIGSVTYSGVTLDGTVTNPTDAATKAYVDSVASGVDIKQAVNVATTTILPFSPTYTPFVGVGHPPSGAGDMFTATSFGALVIDGYTVLLNDRVLVKNQVDEKQNGIYTLTTLGTGAVDYVLTRATDYDNSIADQAHDGTFTFVENGTQAGTGWVETNVGTGPSNEISFNVDNLVFTQFSGAGTYLNGAGLTLTGNTFSVNVDNVTIYINGSNQIAVDSSAVAGQTLLSTGTVGTTATWGAVDLTNSGAVSGSLPVNRGGTGDTTFTSFGVVYGNGTAALGVTAAGTTGQVFVGNTGSAPTWSTLSGIAVTSFQTSLSGLTPTVATTGAVTLAGTLGVLSGGTGDTTLTSFAVLIGEGTSPIAQVLAGAQYQVLTANAGTSADPVFGAVHLDQTAAVTGTLAFGSGGTGATSYTTNGVLYAGASALLTTAVGLTGQVLVGNTGAAPSWSTLSGIAVTSFQTSLSGLTPSTATTGAVTLAGTLGVPSGGTGDITLTPFAVLVGEGTSPVNQILASAQYQVLTANNGTSADPVFGAVNLASLFAVSGTLAVGSGGTGDTSLTQWGVLYGNGTSPVGQVAAGTNGQILTATTGAAPTWVTPASIIVTSITGTANQILADATFGVPETGVVTLTIPTTFIAPGSLSYVTQLLFSNEIIAAAGSTQGTATPITESMTEVNPVAAGAGVILPVPLGLGETHTITNDGINPLLIYPNSGYGLDGAATNAGVSLPPGEVVSYYADTGSTWTSWNDAHYAGIGLSVNHNTAGGVTYSNTGVLSFSAGTTGFSPSIATSGNIVLTGILNPANGGTGVANLNTSTITLAGPLVTVGANSLTLTTTGPTSVTVPTSGTLLSTTNSSGNYVSSITGTANEITASASTGAVTLSTPAVFIAPGSIASTSTITAATGLTLTYGTVDSFLYVGAAGAVISTAAAINGQILIGSTGSVPVVSTLTAGTGITITNAAGSITIAQTSGADVTSIAGTANQITASASTGAVTLSIPNTFIAPGSIASTSTITAATGLTLTYGTPDAFLYTDSTSAVQTTAAATNGQILIGSTGSVPVANTITAGTAISIANAAGSITINNTGVTSNVAGTGISVSGATGAVTIANTGVLSIAGTANQITASASTGAVTLSIPNTFIAPGSIASTTTITATTGLTLTYGTPDAFVYSGAAGAVLTTASPAVGQLLIGSGSGIAPVAATLTAGTGITITNAAGSITIAQTAGSNVTSISFGTTGLTPSIATTGAVTVSGTLVVANGGTGAATLALNGVLYGNGTSPVGVVAAGTTGQVLVATTSAAPSWSTLSGIAVTSFQTSLSGLTPSTATTGAVTLAGTLNATSGGTGTSTAPTSGQILVGTVGGEYVPFTITTGTGISTTTGSGTLQINNTGVQSISFGTTGLLPSTATTGAVIVTGTLAIASGGTGQTTKQAAFDALSPLGTTGDTLYYNGTHNVALALGTTGQVLTVVSGEPAWATLPPGGVTSVTGTANEITASPTTGAVILSTPVVFIAPGSVQVTTSFQTSATNTISAAGSTQGTATALTTDYNVVTTVAANSGVILPVGLAGNRITIINKGANSLNVYPAVGGQIDGLGTNVPYIVLANTSYEVEAVAATQWYSIVSGTPSPMTTTGDMIYEASPGVAARLPLGLAQQVLTVNNAVTAPAWQGPGFSNVVAVPVIIPADYSYVVIEYLTLNSTLTLNGNLRIL